MDKVFFGNLPGDGTGQTIAIIVAYDYPTALADAQAFSMQFGLPLFNQTGGPTFARVAQDGSSNYPGTDPAGAGNASGTWEREAALDIEWAHAMAPMANIMLVEASSAITFPAFPLIVQAANWARQQPNVSVISLSFSGNESFSELSLDRDLITPPGHQGITFVTASGDTGSPVGYPASSPYVVGVGGTSLVLSAGGYSSESAWNKSGGGISAFESKPWYQVNLGQSASQRTSPDISLVGDPNTGVAIYDSWDNPSSPWIKLGGTSLSAPLFAGMMAVVNQGRAYYGLGSLDGFSETLPAIYSAPAADFHDITTGGNNTYSAGPGYDLVTGRGSPVANLLIPYLVGAIGSIAGTVYQDNNLNGVNDNGDATLSGVQLYVDANGNGVFDQGQTQSLSSGAILLTIPDNNTAGVSSQLTVAGMTGTISDINVSLSISHSLDSQLTAYLVGPDGSRSTLFSRLGGFSANFTGTTFDDQAPTAISSGTAPFTGSYSPAWLLKAFNGKSPNGNWTLQVVDGMSGTTGVLENWSITVTTGSEVTTLSSVDGTYSLGPLSNGLQTVRMIPPQDHQASGVTSYNLILSGNVDNANFALVQTQFTSAGPDDIFHLWISQGLLAIGKSANTVNQAFLLPAIIEPTFYLTNPGSTLIVDFINGSPLALANVMVNGAGIADSQVRILGAATTLTLSDLQISASGGGVLQYTSLGMLDLLNGTIYYHGNLSTLRNLIVDSGTIFYWN